MKMLWSLALMVALVMAAGCEEKPKEEKKEAKAPAEKGQAPEAPTEAPVEAPAAPAIPGEAALQELLTGLEKGVAAGDLDAIFALMPTPEAYADCKLANRSDAEVTPEMISESVSLFQRTAEMSMANVMKKGEARQVLAVEHAIDEKVNTILGFSEYKVLEDGCPVPAVASAVVWLQPEGEKVYGARFILRGGEKGWFVESGRQDFAECAQALYQGTFICQKLGEK